jgi:hypothetical protein
MAKAKRQPKVVVRFDPKTLEAFREFGRTGGLVGGKARAKKLSAERRREIARKAALARWRRQITH